MGSGIHATAIVDPAAKIGAGVEIGAYSIIGPNVQLGDRCWVGPHAVVEGITTIGEETEIFQFACVGSRPQDLKFHGEPSTLVIGKRNKIREYVTIQPGTEAGNMTTTVGDSNLFMANSHVGHDCIIGSRNIFANSCGLAGHVTVFDGATLGGLVGVHQFVRIGNNAFLSGGSMVGSDIPPYCTGQGDRCRLRGINLVGLERSGFTQEEINGVKKTYRALFSTVGHLAEKIQELPAELTSMPAIKRMLDFIASSERGVCQPARSGKSE